MLSNNSVKLNLSCFGRVCMYVCVCFQMGKWSWAHDSATEAKQWIVILNKLKPFRTVIFLLLRTQFINSWRSSQLEQIKLKA